MSIGNLFEAKQAILKSKLDNILLEHSTTKGEHCEATWIEFFRSFLPSKYAIGKGFVFDSTGQMSEQIDIIIYDALYAPLIFKTDAGEKYVTAESVYAVFESKPKINKGNLEYANGKVASVRRLKRSSRGMINAGKEVPPRELTPIIGGILAVDAVENDTIEKHLGECFCVDIGCAIKKTSFISSRNVDGVLTGVQFSKPEESILSFFYIVLDSLYRLGTVGGVDIRDYADVTVESIKLPR